MSSSTPENVSIERRRTGLRFEGFGDMPHWDNISISEQVFLDTFSCYLPLGEHFFIDSVRFFQDKIHNDRLREEVKNFIYQEAQHSISHQSFNNALYAKNRLARFSELYAWVFTKFVRLFTTKRFQLSITTAVEHFTALISNVLLNYADGLLNKNISPSGIMWIWHAIEETEHKSVAFDVFMEVTPNKYWAYLLRIAGMVVVSITLFPITLINMSLVYIGNRYSRAEQGKDRSASGKSDRSENSRQPRMVADQEGTGSTEAPQLKDNTSGSKITLQKRGPWHRFFTRVVFRVSKPYTDYYKFTFHPWQHDNSKLLNEIKAKFDFNAVTMKVGN